MTKKRLIVGAVVATIALAAGFYFFNGKNPANEPATHGASVVRIGYPVLRIALPVFVAQEKGFFDKHGLSVELVRYETAQPMMDALVGGSIDVGGFTALPITLSAIARSKTPLIFIGSMMEDDKHPISFLLGREGAEVTSISALGGKRIGILPTRAYEAWLRAVLEAHGVDPLSVVIQQIPPPQQAVALQSGSVDALFTNDPASTAAQTLGAGKDMSPGRALVPATLGLTQFYFGSFNVTKSFADRSPDVVRRLSLALDEAMEYVNQHPDEAKAAMSAYLPKEQQALIGKFPASYFRKTNETTQADLDTARDYYLGAQILSVPLDLDGAQYQRRD